MFNAVYINFAECYGPEGSLPLREALEALLDADDVSTYRNDGFVTVHCPVTDESYFLYDGCAVTRGPDGRVIVLEDMEPFRQEVSKAMTYIKALYPTLPTDYDRFIIPAPKPDPLVEIIGEINDGPYVETKAEYADRIRAALDARGLEIRSKNDD
jgi:hypothetical protein